MAGVEVERGLTERHDAVGQSKFGSLREGMTWTGYDRQGQVGVRPRTDNRPPGIVQSFVIDFDARWQR